MKKKRIIILGAGELQVPAIIQSKQLGYETIVIDMDENAVGISYADSFYPISTLDEEALDNLTKKLKPVALFTMATDAPIFVIAKVCEKNNIPFLSLKDSLCATDKGEMRKRLKEFNLPIPKFYIIESFKQLINIVNNSSVDLILKPSDSSGSRGINVINRKQENLESIYQSTRAFSKNNLVLLEEIMEGPEVSVEALTVNGFTNIIAITDKLTSGPPNFVEMGHSIPSQLSDEIKTKINDIVKKVVAAIGIKNGPSHTELIITSSGPKVVEIGARLGGDYITSHLVPLATGVNIVKQSICLAMNDEVCLKPESELAGSAIRYVKSKPGKIFDIKVPNEYDKNTIKKFQMLYKKGDNIEEISSSVKRIGFVIAKADTAEIAISECNKFLNNLFVVTEDS